jgi:cell division protease FtsH
MGHALLGLALGGDTVHKVSIIPRGIGALGYTIQRPTEDRFLQTREELERRITVLLGGRGAEWVVFGHLSTGAADDLAKATDIARDMVMRHGMEPSLGYAAWESPAPRWLDVPMAEPLRHSPQTQAQIDQAVRSLVDAGFERARAWLEAHRARLDRGAQALLAQETLDEAALRALARDAQA